MDVGAVLQQELDDARAVVAGGQVERRRLAAVAGVAVDVERRQQLQDLVLAAAARRLQQLLFAVVAREDGPRRRVGHVLRRLGLGVAHLQTKPKDQAALVIQVMEALHILRFYVTKPQKPVLVE